MIDYDSARHIEILNKYLGMEHRTDSFNLNESSDLKGALEYAVAAYRDYHHYRSTLGGLVESFDESVEYFDTVSWVNMARTPENADDLTIDCASSLSIAYNNFIELSERAEEHLSVILKVTLTAPDEVQREILGNSYDIDPSEIEERLERLFVALSYAEYHREIPDNFKTFLEVLYDEWENFEPDTEFEPMSGLEPPPF